ncbi:helix-turn-helix domain-containing protein [Sphingobacterium lactis]|uniref:helix-turn-helix domain-containing protein n=1 Tax=Sphingobacterium lactis TaxID=797291 RepID=UPI003DA6CD70
MTKIGDIIRLKRIEMGVSQKHLASQLGVDVSYLCKVEKNEKSITLGKLLQISKLLEVDCVELKNVYYANKFFELLNSETNEFIKSFLHDALSKLNK